MAVGLLDLSIITHDLVAQLDDYVKHSKLSEEDDLTTPPSIVVSGSAPDVTRPLVEGCQLSVLLFHVAPDKFYRNTYPTGGPAQRVPEQPLALALYFLVTAFSPKGHVEEQQAMSIALKFFHEHPSVTTNVTSGEHEETLTISMEPQTFDELGRLWQAFGTPMRLAVVYRAAVAFLEPPVEARIPKRVEKGGVGLDVIPYLIPSRLAARVTTTAGVATIVLAGANLGATTTVQLDTHLMTPTATPAPEPDRFHVVDDTTLVLKLPAVTPRGGSLLLVTPEPGIPARAVWLVPS
jgi:hypothetical protein